jgi:hypothetical protein
MFYCFIGKLDEIAKKNTMQYRKNREIFQWLNFLKIGVLKVHEKLVSDN